MLYGPSTNFCRSVYLQSANLFFSVCQSVCSLSVCLTICLLLMQSLCDGKPVNLWRAYGGNRRGLRSVLLVPSLFAEHPGTQWRAHSCAQHHEGGLGPHSLHVTGRGKLTQKMILIRKFNSSDTHTHTHTRARAHAHAHTHTHTHTYTHTHKHTLIHTHTHAYSSRCSPLDVQTSTSSHY